MRQTEEDRPKPQIARIPYFDGLSQEVCRIANVVNVRCVFNAPRMLQHLYNVKDQLAEDTVRNAVYSIKCKTCKKEYIGETQRAIGVRKKEHQSTVRLADFFKSAIAEHVHSEDPVDEVEWSGMKVIDRAGKKIERKVREAMHIHRNKPDINRDGGVEHSSEWTTILNYYMHCR